MTRVGFSESFLLAGKGIFEGIAKDRNTKIHLFVGLAVIIVSLLLKISRVEFLIIGIICFLVIVLELFNNCMERIIDVIFPYYNKELGKVKDIFAGIVLSADFLAVIVGFLILYKPLLNALGLSPESVLICLIVINILLTVMVVFVCIRKIKTFIPKLF